MTVVNLFSADTKANSHTLWASDMQTAALDATFKSDRLTINDRAAIRRAVPFLNTFIESITISRSLKNWPVDLIVTKGDEGEIYFSLEMVPKLGKQKGDIVPNFVVIHHPVLLADITDTFCSSSVESTLQMSSQASAFFGLRYKRKEGYPRASTIAKAMDMFQAMADVHSNGYLTKEEVGKVTYTFFHPTSDHSLMVSFVLPAE